MSKLRNLQNIHQTSRDGDCNRDDGVVDGVDADGRHLFLVVIFKHQKGTLVFIRHVSAVHNLVTSLIHTEGTDHLSENHGLSVTLSLILKGMGNLYSQSGSRAGITFK